MVAISLAAGQVFAGGHKALPSDAAEEQVLRIATSSAGENSFIFTGLSGGGDHQNWQSFLWVPPMYFDENKELELQIINEELWANNDEFLEQEKSDQRKNKSFTIIKFEELRYNFNKRDIDLAKSTLESIYRRVLNKSLIIQWGEEKLEWEDYVLTKKDNGSEAKWPFSTQGMDGDGREREVRGWIGVLDSYSDKPERGAKSTNAGIAIFRNGRGIVVQPKAWRPSSIFASGQGSLTAQRVVGEVDFDESDVSFDKTGLSPNDLTLLDHYLGGHYSSHDIGRYAKRRAASAEIVDQASDNDSIYDAQKVLEESNLSEKTQAPIPPDSIIQKRIKRTFDTVDKEKIIKFSSKPFKIELYPEYNNESAPFCAYNSPKKNLIQAVLNMHHRYISQNLVNRNEYFTFIILMIIARYKIETDDRLTMDNYFEVLDSVLKIEVKRK